jgi:D-glycero-alpha-D-manno-heptose-7-phosphate kinase
LQRSRDEHTPIIFVAGFHHWRLDRAYLNGYRLVTHQKVEVMYAHARAPVRIGIAGGGTDLPAWTRDRIGRCLSLAIKSYTHAVAIARPDGQVVASYLKRDAAQAATEIANGLIRESALLHGWEDGFEVHTLSELSSHGSGLGVSSSIAVSLAACFQQMAALRDNKPNQPHDQLAQHVAQDAWTVEIDRLRRPIGRQDHMAAAHGGLRLYAFAERVGAIERTFNIEAAQWIADHLLLVPLPTGHDSRSILSAVKDTIALEHAAAAVNVAIDAIEQQNVALLGRALHFGSVSKRQIRGAVPAEVASLLERVDAIPGVRGSKVAGAGGGGHIVIARDGNTRDVRAAIERVTNLPTFAVEPDFHGVRVEGYA